jgi:hypothetical protein
MITETKEKHAAQRLLERNLKQVLKGPETCSIGIRIGNTEQKMYSAGEGRLWVVFGGVNKDSTLHRYWNAFGIYQPGASSQSIAVEINITTEDNSRQVAGFFARDVESDKIFLMHTGKVGGGRKGIGKSAFLRYSKAKLVEVCEDGGAIRDGIIVGELGHPNFARQVEAFVSRAQRFKDAAVRGDFETPEFERKIEEYDRYTQEFSGRKQGYRGGPFEYITCHGDIVQALYDERSAQRAKGEEVFNSQLMDLFVKKNGVVSEVYEVKTGCGRQLLYTAIGQLVTHAAIDGHKVSKHLVVPADEMISEDLEKAFDTLGIQVRYFTLDEDGQVSLS